MDRHIARSVTFKKLFSFFLAIALLTSSLTSVAAALPDASLSGEISPATNTLLITDRQVDPDTSNDMGFINVPRVHDGRIWTDKSVTPGLEEDDFTVTLSALSQSFSTIEGYAIPADTVFVIDVSGSMANTDPGAELSRITFLIEALNEAIGILQDANPQNRLAVVAYGGVSGGYARVQHVLALGRYTAVGSNFFSVSGSTVTVNASPVPGSGGNRVVSSLRVEGSTPTQWGIYEGAQILEQASTTVVVPMTDIDGTVTDVTVTRRPNLVLMTDGEPTMGWSNYAFDSGVASNPVIPGSSGNQIVSPLAPAGFVGDGLYGELGVSLLTVLTASHRKQLVLDHYFPTGTPSGQAGQPGPSVGFYTIGLGAQPTQAATDLIRATMDPFNVATDNNADAIHSNIRSSMNLPSGYTTNPYASPSDPSMGDLLRNFAATSGASADFNAQRRIAHGNYIWDAAPIEVINTVDLTLPDLDYADAFFEATNLDTLRDAFMSITTDIQTQSIEMVTDVPGDNPDFDGWLVFSDVLGEYMEFRDDLQLFFDDILYARDTFDLSNTTILDTYAPILYEHMNYGVTSSAPEYVPQTMIDQLLQFNIDAGNTKSVVYYADANRNFIGATNPGDAAARVEAFPMIGILSEPVVSGGQTNLMYITVHVLTALEGGTFTEVYSPAVGPSGAHVPTNRTLVEGDQIVRWYIPASLIPMRSVDAESGEVSGNIDPIRISYTVGLNQEQVLNGVSIEYLYANAAPDDSTYFYSNRWRNNEDVTLSFERPNAHNPFYQPGRPGFSEGRGVIIKSANNTKTAGHSSYERSLPYGNDIIDLNWLGNNGRLTIQLPQEEVPPPPEPPFVDPPSEEETTPPPPEPPFVEPPPPPDEETPPAPPPPPPGETPPPGDDVTPPPDDSQDSSPTSSTVGPSTGDDLQAYHYLALMFLSAAYISSMFAYGIRKKRRHLGPRES
ncbi:MAG: VWA domain-containing protein [Coriobacteriia bacterium]|nr:VWA domain-containing protein [Coriobacteriia bacterium]